MSEQKRTFAVLVENTQGVLNKTSGRFAARGYNIDSLGVGVTEDKTTSRMTIDTHGEPMVLDQIEKQLDKLPVVLKVVNLSALSDVITSELMFVRVRCNKQKRPHLLQIAESYRAEIRNINTHWVLLMVSGDEDKNNAFVELVKKEYGIIELVRGGKIAISRNTVIKADSIVKRKK